MDANGGGAMQSRAKKGRAAAYLNFAVSGLFFAAAFRVIGGGGGVDHLSLVTAIAFLIGGLLELRSG